MSLLDIFARCYVSRKSVGALPQEIIDFLLSPGGHSLLIKGDAGTGKTTMALQMIEALSDQQPEYYLSSRVSDVALYNQFPWLKERVRSNQLLRAGMAFLRRSWNVDSKERRDLDESEVQVDRRELNRLEGQIEAGELGMDDEDTSSVRSDGSIVVEIGSMLPELEMAYDIVESNLPRKTLVVLDSVEALAENYGIPASRIVNALQKDLVEKAGTNVVFVMETSDSIHLDFLGDGVVTLRNEVIGDHRVRTIDIVKLRGSEIRNWRYLFTLEGGRVAVMDRDLDLNGLTLPRSTAEPPPGRGTLGWSEMDRLFGGAPLGSLTILEVGQGVPMDLLERMELAMVSEHLHNERGVIWYPQRTLDYATLPAQLKHAGAANVDKLHILDANAAMDGSFSFVKKLEGEDLANDLRWDSLKYLLKGAGSPYVSLLGLDALESVYGPKVVPKILQHIDTMRRGGHLVILEATDGSLGLEPLSHQARLHIRLENINGSVVLRGIKPRTIYHCLEFRDGFLRWAPML
jgi:KaiC/GvpD/RAD55 family RecA-like ATPase